MAALRRRLKVESAPTITATLRPDTELISLTAVAPDPKLASRAANAVGVILIRNVKQFNDQSIRSADKLFVERIAQLERELSFAVNREQELAAKSSLTPSEKVELLRLRETIRIKRSSATAQQLAYEQGRLVQEQRSNTLRMVIPATPPTTASSPRVKMNVVLGTFFGLLGGSRLSFLLESRSGRLRSPNAIQQATGLPVIGRIPWGKLDRPSPLFEIGSTMEEAFRRLRVTLLAGIDDSKSRTILITSAEQNEGKSMVVSNLAYTIALSGQRVLVIDADMRLPTQHTTFDVSNKDGLSTALVRHVTVGRGFVTSTPIPGLTVLAAGAKPDDPAEQSCSGSECSSSSPTCLEASTSSSSTPPLCCRSPMR